MNALLSTAQWVVGKALAPVADGVLEAWGATNNLGLNIEALKMELLLVKATLKVAAGKQISGQALEELLGKLRHSAHCAEDLLDELDYFRIHDKLHGTYEAADQHAKGCLHNLSLNARHAAKAVLGLSACSSAANPAESGQLEDARQQFSCRVGSCGRQRTRPNSSSTPNVNQEVSGCMPKLGKLLPCLSSPHVHDGNSAQSTLCGAQHRETPMPRFNRVDISERMKHIVEQLQPVRREVTKILQSCDRITIPDFSHGRPITTDQSIEPKLYGRDQVVNTMIHDMTKGKYHSKDLTVLPIVGPGGIGKTTLIQHIYNNKDVKNYLQVMSWVCVSLSFTLNKLLEDIEKAIPKVDGEKGDRPEQLIAQRLKSKRFLLVLDDIWECGNEDDWKRLLLPLKTSQEKGCMILVTTRFPAIAKMVGTTVHSIELEGLNSKYFTELFYAFVFGDEQCKRDHNFLLEIGVKIMAKLKGSPLAAKTVGRLLRKELNLRHWRRVLDSKEWERQSGVNDIMPALKLSYDYLPFHLQQCFSYSALFPEDFWFTSSQLINLWMGLDILQPADRNQTFQDRALRNLNDLVTHGFFKKEETNGYTYYVMHDMLHDLALQVASHDCVSLHHSNMGSIEIQPSIRHLSIIIDDVGVDKVVSLENLKSELRKLGTRLKVEYLQTLMLFGGVDENITHILGDLFREANALRVLHLPTMPCPVESMLHNFSTLVHLRYLCLGTKYGMEMHLPLAISRFYHLRILDLGSWYGHCDLPKDLSNLEKICHLYTKSNELHSDIVNVGKLKLLEELKIFKVNKESEGFEPKQLEHLTELRELGIYNLENIHTEEEAAKAKLIEKNYLERLRLDWDNKRSHAEPGVEAVVLESLQPHRYLQDLCIRGHGGHSCPTWLGDKLAVEALRSLHLIDVSWEGLPSLQKMWGLDTLILEHIAVVEEFVIEESFCRLIRLELVGLGSFEKWVPSQDAHHMFPLLQVLVIRDCPKLLELPFSNHIVYPKPDQDSNTDWFPKLQKVVIQNCPELLIVAHIPWSETLCSVSIHDVKQLEKLEYSTSSYSGIELQIVGKDDLQSLDQVLAFSNLRILEELILESCPPPESKHLLLLPSLKKLQLHKADGLVAPLGGQDDVEWQHPVEYLVVQESCGASGKDLTELLTHLPRLSRLDIIGCKNITQLVVAVDLQQTMSAAASEVEQEKEEDGLLLFPTHLCGSLRELDIFSCLELVLVDPPSTVLPAKGGGGFQALRSLQTLVIADSPKILPAKSFSCCPFPPSLQDLYLDGVKGMGTLDPLSNLTSLTHLKLCACGEDLRCNGLGPLLTTGGQLRELYVSGSPRFFAGWDPNPTQVVQDEGGEEQELVSQSRSSKLQVLLTVDVVGLLVVPICSFLSSSLTHLGLSGAYGEIERFTRDQEDALLLLAALEELDIWNFSKLESLPTGLHKLTNLKRLCIELCPSIRSLPKDGLPKSLQELDLRYLNNKDLNEQCRGLVGTIKKIRLQRRS